ncbi:hypothetical protein D9M68_436220 [compost metagenome]
MRAHRSDAIAGTESHAAPGRGELHALTAPLPQLWREDPQAGEAIGNFLCVVLRNDARAEVAVTASAEACAVLQGASYVLLHGASGRDPQATRFSSRPRSHTLAYAHQALHDEGGLQFDLIVPAFGFGHVVVQVSAEFGQS